ncbi:hypothetical protein EML15_08060 [Corynebacterium sp. sy017]|uniref:hypothetical protein n=1 Tax=unclassified Corynebacterium TaxID=2624378 RepID=UPI001185095F|nr:MULTISPECIES: hypothetical protein [unclassified Corynebacterium]MBP3089097.1 hypothetical protein [Corynebacterium sp. sy017]TSD91411.1 hypothetical protein ELY17_08070 [Corynebacterium sp. SY003]
MDGRKIRIPFPELALARIGAIAILIGVCFSIGSIATMGIPLIIVSLIAAVLTPPASLLHNRGQFILIAIGTAVLIGGIWYGVNIQEDTAIFSPVLIWFAGAALMMSAIFTLLIRSQSKAIITRREKIQPALTKRAEAG